MVPGRYCYCFSITRDKSDPRRDLNGARVRLLIITYAHNGKIPGDPDTRAFLSERFYVPYAVQQRTFRGGSPRGAVPDRFRVVVVQQHDLLARARAKTFIIKSETIRTYALS